MGNRTAASSRFQSPSPRISRGERDFPLSRVVFSKKQSIETAHPVMNAELCSPQNSFVEVQTPGSANVTIFGDGALKEKLKVI